MPPLPLRWTTLLALTIGVGASMLRVAYAGPTPVGAEGTRGFTPERAHVAAAEQFHRFRATPMNPSMVVLDALSAPKMAHQEGVGRQQIGVSRSIESQYAKASRWQSAPDGGYVTHIALTSPGAQALRAHLVLPEGAWAIELRVTGSDSGMVEALLATDTQGRRQLWTPVTEGQTQVIEIYTPTRPADRVAITELAHLTQSPLRPKVANPCSPDAACTTGDFVLDGALEARRKSVARMIFQSGSGTFFCTGTLINSERAPEPMFLTANHCVSTAAEAASLTTFWFYERRCTGEIAGTTVQRGGGAELVFTNGMVDSTLLRLNQSPPDGVVFAATDASRVANGTPVLALSHPTGDYMKWARGSIQRLTRPTALFPDGRTLDPTYDLYRVLFARGLIEGGSSGSGVFHLLNGQLALAGILSTGGAPSTIANCEATGGNGNYARYEVFGPMIAGYLARTAPVRTDDHGNRPQESTAIALGTFTNGRINYPGDVDLFRVEVPRAGHLVARTLGTNIDVVGALLTADGTTVAANDDGETANNHFSITWAVTPGTYYIMAGHFEPDGVGAYTLEARLVDIATPNYTDIWWAEGESGWGITLNHQDNTIFAALYTYDQNRQPVWAVMPSGARQADGTYAGGLFTAVGTAFNASPWRAATATQVGSMQLRFLSSALANLTYTLNGVSVSKTITRFVYGARTECRFVVEDRSFAESMQDLWWTVNESGWGLNIAQQGTTIFGALYTFDANGRPVWFTMPQGVGAGSSFTGDLFRASGPAFNTTPWTAATATRVGSMTITLDETTLRTATLNYSIDGIAVTKNIERFAFGDLKPYCERAR
jgi:lysyl endopeptidase